MNDRGLIENLEGRRLYTAATATVNDTDFSKQTDMTAISVNKAWATTEGSMNVTVADIDTGLDYDSPDLAMNVWINQGEIPAYFKRRLKDMDGDGLITFYDLNTTHNKKYVSDINGNGYIDAGDLLESIKRKGFEDGIDGDGNGYVDDIVGWDFADNDNNPYDYVGHGSHTAGTIAATKNNDYGIAGIATTSLMVVKIFGDDGTGATEAQIAEAIKYSADNGARVSNNSWGYTISSVGGYSVTMDAANPTSANTTWYPPPGRPGNGGYGGGSSGGSSTDLIEQAIEYAGEKGETFVAAAGNDTADNDYSFLGSYPASYDLDNIVSVAAVDNAGALSYFSNYGGSSVDIAAPGEDVYSTWLKSGYYVASGTSMATPHVTGTIALMLAKNPKLTTAQIEDDLTSTVNTESSLAGYVSSSGMLNAGAAVHMAAVQRSQASGTYSLASAASVKSAAVLSGVVNSSASSKITTSMFSTKSISDEDQDLLDAVT